MSVGQRPAALVNTQNELLGLGGRGHQRRPHTGGSRTDAFIASFGRVINPCRAQSGKVNSWAAEPLFPEPLAPRPERLCHTQRSVFASPGPPGSFPKSPLPSSLVQKETEAQGNARSSRLSWAEPGTPPSAPPGAGSFPLSWRPDRDSSS